MQTIITLIFFWLISTSCLGQPATPESNVLLIILDDLNDKIGGFGEEIQANTPNIDWLRKEAVSFTNAQANVPLCNPSRASFLSGLYPHTTGFYGYNQHQNDWWEFPLLKNSVMLFDHFQQHGYQVYGTGKIFHKHNAEAFTRYHPKAFGISPSFGPYAYNGKKTIAHPSLEKPYGSKYAIRSFSPLSDVPDVPANPRIGIPGYRGWWDKGKPFQYTDENHRDLLTDEESAEWASEILMQKHEKPFFLSVGFVRPHRPQVAPKKYFDMYPLNNIQIPPHKKNDLEDIPEILWKDIEDKEKGKGFEGFRDLMKAYQNNEGWKLWIQSYLACVSFVDAQVGKVLTALRNSPYKDNTIVILTSDHGYHMGEKEYMFKLSVWEESNRIPLIISVPGLTTQPVQVAHPVSLIDLYPTLIDFAGLPAHPNRGKNGLALDGHSLRPFLENPEHANWEGPSVALSVVFGSDQAIDQLNVNEPGSVARQHFTVRSQQYRYTLTNNGQEELYDHGNDPNEWYNLAGDPQYETIKAALKNELLLLTHQK